MKIRITKFRSVTSLISLYELTLYRWKIHKRNENSVGRDEEGGGRNLGEEHTLKTDISNDRLSLTTSKSRKIQSYCSGSLEIAL